MDWVRAHIVKYKLLKLALNFQFNGNKKTMTKGGDDGRDDEFMNEKKNLSKKKTTMANHDVVPYIEYKGCVGREEYTNMSGDSHSLFCGNFTNQASMNWIKSF